MKIGWLAVGLIALGSAAVAQTSDCPHHPEFTALVERLPRLRPAEAVRALERYRATHENPAACEGIEVDHLVGEQEAKMITLSAGSSRINAQAVYHCTEYDAKTTRCDGVTIDDTAHPVSAGIRPHTLGNAQQITIASTQQGVALVAVYEARLADLIDGKSAKALPERRGAVSVRPGMKDAALIAIFKGTGPRRYTKAVWYF